MRRALRDWLGAVGANEDEAYDILVAVGEAAANAIEHAYGPAPAHFEIDADLDGETVAITVRDEGIWRAPRGLHRGRGLGLIQELMDDFDVARAESGTEVRMHRTLGTAAGS
jgi:anti-sigma regulatory factor (Ser/Thr protein kinase)